MATIIHLMGPTCAGKSTIIKAMMAHDSERCGAVEVGKMLRAKYGEDHFKGQAAPEHTQDEAWQMYQDGVRRQIDEGKLLVLVDGQPRELKQATGILELWKDHMVLFILVHARHEVREARARAERDGSNLDLTVQRLNNDYKNCYIVMAELLKAGRRIGVVDTSDMTNVDAAVEQIARIFVKDVFG